MLFEVVQLMVAVSVVMRRQRWRVLREVLRGEGRRQQPWRCPARGGAYDVLLLRAHCEELLEPEAEYYVQYFLEEAAGLLPSRRSPCAARG